MTADEVRSGARVETHPAAPCVAMTYRLPTTDGAVVGLTMAVDGFVHALDRHSTARCELYAEPAELPHARRRLALDEGRAGRQAASLHDGAALLATKTPPEIHVWHDLAFDAWRPFAMRRALGRPCAVTLTHYTLSYRELLHDVFVRLVLEGHTEYDAILCSSTASRRAVARTLELVAERLNASLGTRLSWRGRLEHVPLGVDTDLYRPRERAAARERLGLGGAFVLLWVGRFSATDKADLVPLVTVVNELAAANLARDVVLLCVGTDRPAERFSDVLASYASRIGAAGRVRIVTDARELPSIYAVADVFVSPVDTLQESFGLAVVEAMACGVPQVVSDWDGYRDTVVDGETGFRVPTTWSSCDADLLRAAPFHDEAFDHAALGQSVAVDPAALRDRLQRLLDDEPLRRAMAERSRDRAVREYAAQRIVARHVDLWRELAEAAKADAAPPRPASVLDALPYGDVFGQYATRMLGPDHVLSLTDRGHALGRGEQAAPMHVRIPGVLDATLPQIAVGLLLAAESAGQPATARALVAQVAQRSGAHPAAVKRHVLWLVKYGFVAVNDG